MIRNYIKIAVRNFIKDRFYSLINVLGLALGIASSLIIILYVVHQLSYDNFHPNLENKYRVNQTNIWNPDGGIMSSSVLPLAHVLVNEYPEVHSATRVNTPGGKIMRYIQNGTTEKIFNEREVLAADSNFFDFFGFKLAKGNPHTALIGMNKVVISDAAARKYFGEGNAIGKTLYMGDERVPLEVTGVTAPHPPNSHFKFDFLLSMYTNPNNKEKEWSWIWTQVVTYAELKPGTDPKALEVKFRDIAENHVVPTLKRFHIEYDEFMSGKGDWSFYLQPLKDINLYSGEIGNRLGAVGDINYVYIFLCVAVFVLTLAGINFMNLSTARASARAKEIGVRKVMGSQRQQLIRQFLAESVMVCFIATIIGFGLMELIRISLEQFLSLKLPVSFWSGPILLALLMLLPVLLGCLAGIYPALVLTSFKPVNVLKGKLSTGAGRSWFRNSLVVVQFSISIALIICTFIVYQQLNYFSQKNLGFDRENIIVINNAEKMGDQLESFRNELAARRGVIEASLAMDMIGRGTFEDVFSNESGDIRLPIAQLKVDNHFFNTVGLELVTGRSFLEDRPSDVNAVIINETAMRLYGWDYDNAIGKKIIYMGDDIGPVEVIGVARDFNFQSLRFSVNPFIFFHIKSAMWGSNRVVAIKTTGNDIADILAFTEAKWREYALDNPFEYSFLNEELQNRYQSEQRLGSLFSVFSGFALFIACIGLFGLAAYTISQRNKEIGIRKVLGATVGQLVVMLNGNFLKLVLVSCAIALPMAWYAMKHWLEQFANKIEIGWEVFVITSVLALVIAWLTVSYQSVKAALLNPAQTLKDE
ncbi:putative ABC transporter permease [Fulvivirga imtechensis AK7]|uniref:Putative ABC transporter permease n=1 Tax=Fulvivirga imtechensis AK7 TaxID=1237149 RepID=L8JMN6_9BACT|nr:ABC transporter permease [Fulvivirga imtechensis]ELR70090.1 putative ABC transporter permease [Fulvivirga imtechensis AK7]